MDPGDDGQNFLRWGRDTPPPASPAGAGADNIAL